MEHLFEGLLEKAKTDKKLLIKLKECAVNGKQYELVSHLAEIEKNFDEPQEVKDALRYASDIQNAFAVVNIRPIEKKVCWLMGKILDKYRELGGKMSMKDIAEIEAKFQELFKNQPNQF